MMKIIVSLSPNYYIYIKDSINSFLKDTFKKKVYKVWLLQMKINRSEQKSHMRDQIFHFDKWMETQIKAEVWTLIKDTVNVFTMIILLQYVATVFGEKWRCFPRFEAYSSKTGWVTVSVTCSESQVNPFLYKSRLCTPLTCHLLSMTFINLSPRSCDVPYSKIA